MLRRTLCLTALALAALPTVAMADRLVVTAAPDYFPRWSPDGSRLAWAYGSSPSNDRGNLNLIRPDGTGQVLGGCSECSRSLDWTDDAHAVAIKRNVGIVHVDLTTATHTTIEPDPTAQWVESIDADTVAYRTGSSIFRTDVDGTGKTLMAEGTEFDVSDDGSTVVYRRLDGGLSRMAADGTGRTDLTGPDAIHTFVVSPDGSRVAASRGGALVILENGGERPVNTASSVGVYEWTGDARHLFVAGGGALQMIRSSDGGLVASWAVTNIGNTGVDHHPTTGRLVYGGEEGGAFPFYWDLWTADAPLGGSTATVAPGGTADSGPATADYPVQTAITVPSGGSVTVEEVAQGAAPAGFDLIGPRLLIEAPSQTPPDFLTLAFTVDASQAPAGQIEVWRDDVAVAPCTTAGVLGPDPCVSSRETLGDGDRRVTVLSSHASEWTLGASSAPPPPPEPFFEAPVDNRPTINTVRRGRTVPVKFSLGGDRGLEIFADGYPRFESGPCEGGPSDAIETTTTGAEGLRYDAASGRYTYAWNAPDRPGRCGDLVMRFDGGREERAHFQIR